MIRRPRRSDAGLSLVEVLVGVALFTVLSGLVAGFVIDMLRTSTGTTNRLANVDTLRVSMDGVTKSLRTAIRPEQVNSGCLTAPCEQAFVTRAAREVTFYANRGMDNVRLTTYQVTLAGELVEIVRAAAVPDDSPETSCGTGCTRRTLAQGVEATATVFGFADDSCTNFATTVPLDDIACVRVNLPVEGARDNPGTSATSTVFLPNSAMGR